MAQKLFVDTNIFLYFLTKHKDKWDKIAELFNDTNYEFITNILVLNELKYKLLWLSASEKIKTTNKFAIINRIKKDKKLRTSVYSKYLEFYLNLKNKFDILDITNKEEILSCSISTKYGLLPTDASIVANMMQNNIEKILTNDEDFKRVDKIEVIQI